MAAIKGRVALVAASVCLVGVIFVAVALVFNDRLSEGLPHAEVKSSRTPDPPTAKIVQSLHPDVPLEIRVPALEISGTVHGVGLNSKGEMDEPSSRDEITWYKPGYLPGALGNAVFAGHSDYMGSQGVFYNLHEISTNDTIEVLTASHILTFTATDKKTYQNDDVASDLFGPSEISKLNLITCSGAWDTQSRRYTERLVVVATFTAEKAL